jgi:hypothetical protein
LSIVHTNLRDSLQTIDHSSGDVAYLRITAHTEEKATTNELHVCPRQILDTEFQTVFNMTKNIPPYQSSGICEKSDSSTVSIPKLVQIGDSVYAADTIASKTFSSVKQDIIYCLDQLICRSNQNFLMEVLLRENNFMAQHIICITLQLKDMSDFGVINPVYASYFSFPLPPSRVTISTNISERVCLSAIISTRPRTGLHVQSRGFWAPANIGPYSQSISVCPLKNGIDSVR